MLFNSSEFIFVFLPLAVGLHFLLARVSITAAVVATTLASLAFYMWWNPPFVLLPMLSIVGNFAVAQAIRSSDKEWSRRLLIIGITANLLVLGFFKYGDFIASIFEVRGPNAPAVPLALSFTTFVQIAFLVDVWRRRSRVEFPIYAMFVSFFPHLIAGPIVRWNELGPQLRDLRRYRVDWHNIALGLTIFCLGLSKKVLIADKLSRFVAPVFDAAARGEPLTAAAAWGASYCYTAQLYFDFSGYSDMAVGLGLLFNLRLPINFAAPLRAASMIELWRRWHVTLSRFLRDFVYLPLGGSAAGPLRRTVNLFITMVLGGLWHGANWTFVLWGAFHGVLLAVNHLWRQYRGPGVATATTRLAGWAATFTAFVIGMVLFRASDLATALNMFEAMAGFGGAGRAETMNVAWDSWGMREGLIPEEFVRVWLGANWSVVGSLWTAAALAIALLVPDTMELVGYREGEPHARWRREVGMLKWQPSPLWAAALIALFAAVYANLLNITEFLYYQF
jgi:D-alanyl-lipoteichoic acid acyltransferase DltB (MBOAT superfamily)